uniref:ATP synthase subunit a n=1 Tax=Scaptocoris castanea TaxID=1411909 RepID=A0A343YVQ8_9HEMI|nr:ATP synthase F0 subunit 6 [Scaptocoris castanea]
MMTNLFSTFDPSTTLNTSMNWLSTPISIMILPLVYWVSPNRISWSMQNMMLTLHEEFKTLLNQKQVSGSTLLLTSMLMFILVNNITGILPYTFTSSSHLTFTLTLALPAWSSVMLFGWISNTKSMLAHLVPTSTPMMLMPFMVMIESISNLIRPGSLAVRLTANMIAGHLLMSLLGNTATNNNTYPLLFMIPLQMMLMTFEIAVALIQAYVFSVLSTLYTSEVQYE